MNFRGPSRKRKKPVSQTSNRLIDASSLSDGSTLHPESQKKIDSFIELLREVGVTSKSSWHDTRSNILDREQYISLGPKVAEDSFRKHCEKLLEEEARERIRLAEIQKRREE